MDILKSLAKTPLAEGKTKRIFESISDPTKVFVISKDDITAGDGAKHDLIEGKAMLANRTTCNVFRLLKACGIPVAFEEQIDNQLRMPDRFKQGFLAPKCAMLPYEVVIRREAHGSYLQRAPHLAKGHIFPRLVLEFFLKTNSKKWKDHLLICDDPYMIHDADAEQVYLYDPKQSSPAQNLSSAFLKLPEKEVFRHDDETKLMKQMGVIARQVFLILEKAWQLEGRKLVDFKVEFGLGPNGELLLADVIDNDSWRVMDKSGEHIDKQVYRDGGDLNTVTAKYRQVAELTSRFSIPLQHLTFWRVSEREDLKPFYETIDNLALRPKFATNEFTCPINKQPGPTTQHLQDVSDTVIIAYVGRSDGAYLTLSASTTAPIIMVPAGYKDSEDVWSLLRTPSNVPVMTVLEPANATLAALQILSMRNPSIYAALRYDQETYLTGI